MSVVENPVGRRFCGTPEPRGAMEVRWRKTSLTWRVTGGLPGMLQKAFEMAVAEACGLWQSVCGLVFSRAADGAPADITVTTGSIDGQNGTLAWSEMPNGSDSPITQRYDTAEQWDRSVDLVSVIAHELGHGAIGLGHDSQGSGALMAPTYSSNVLEPTVRDAARAVAQYGPPVIVPPPVDPDDIPTNERVIIQVYEGRSKRTQMSVWLTGSTRIEIPGYKVSRL